MLIKPNLAKLIELVGKPLERDEDRIAACRKLTAGGRAQAVALTLGDDGALLVTAGQAWRAQPMAIEMVSAVGAGDSFLGGMVLALAAGKPLEQAFRVAVASGLRGCAHARQQTLPRAGRETPVAAGEDRRVRAGVMRKQKGPSGAPGYAPWP